MSSFHTLIPGADLLYAMGCPWTPLAQGKKNIIWFFYFYLFFICLLRMMLIDGYPYLKNLDLLLPYTSYCPMPPRIDIICFNYILWGKNSLDKIYVQLSLWLCAFKTEFISFKMILQLFILAQCLISYELIWVNIFKEGEVILFSCQYFHMPISLGS